MIIDDKLCTGCGKCMVYCPVEAIIETAKQTAKGKNLRAVDLDQCVECGNCLRSEACPVDALFQQPLEWPRSIRSAFSNPKTEHKSKDMGRGTEEMKTNEVTHRFGEGEVGIAVELGRPLLGTSFRDVDRVTQAVARVGVEFEARNPLTALLEDPSRGVVKREILNERVLSTIVEFKIRETKLEEVLLAVKEVAGTLDTVFSLGLIRVLPPQGRDPVMEIVERLGFEVRPNGKVNLGLGRPISNDPGPSEGVRRSDPEGRLS
jgi:NAD-dependent dihydropyrimidine dehydrogenase PreA subunit